MKSLVQAVIIAATLAAPVVVFAQAGQPLTRAEVRQQLLRIEKAGYNPARSNPIEYPANVQSAQARVAAEDSAVGGVSGGASQEGRSTGE